KTENTTQSVAWGFFNTVDAESVQCLLCRGLVRHGQGNKGTTTNMLRHLRVKHPAEFVKKIKGRLPETSSIDNGAQDMEADSEQFCSVALEDETSETLTTGYEDDVTSSINGIVEAAQEGPADKIMHEEESDDRPVRSRQNRRSLIWRHYERLDSLAAVRCRICMKKIKCFEGGSTSNLHRHMSKRHPGVFSQLVANGKNPPRSRSSQESTLVSLYETKYVVFSSLVLKGVLKVSRASDGEKGVFRRELELIEALRRAQREEARALEYQRELLEKLRAVNAREAAAEREQIESLRKAQLEEAKDLSRQKEELEMEKEELQKKWEELQQEREELLISREEAS
uniref:BED-type domain-containing protein n=1 Tax=Dicentrarchus labrax TaxID=13489 RepID=A0A8C4EVE5_DICLA